MGRRIHGDAEYVTLDLLIDSPEDGASTSTTSTALADLAVGDAIILKRSYVDYDVRMAHRHHVPHLLQGQLAHIAVRARRARVFFANNDFEGQGSSVALIVRRADLVDDGRAGIAQLRTYLDKRLRRLEILLVCVVENLVLLGTEPRVLDRTEPGLGFFPAMVVPFEMIMVVRGYIVQHVEHGLGGLAPGGIGGHLNPGFPRATPGCSVLEIERYPLVSGGKRLTERQKGGWVGGWVAGDARAKQIDQQSLQVPCLGTEMRLDRDSGDRLALIQPSTVLESSKIA